MRGLVPFGLLPDGPGGLLWRLTSSAVFCGGLAWWGRIVLPPGQRALLFLLTAPLTFGNIHNGQANVLIMGLLLLAVAAVARERFTVAALCLAIACLFNAGEYQSDYVPKLQDFCSKHLDDISNQGFGHWHYAHLYYAQVKYREGGDEWETYRDKIYSKLIGEVTENGKHAFWNQGDGIGPIYSTAINLTILQLENGALPIYQR